MKNQTNILKVGETPDKSQTSLLPQRANTEDNQAKSTGHTPGPWTSNEDGQIQSKELNNYGNWIVATIGRPMSEQDHANARLIAAAPELLEACKAAIKEIKNCARDCMTEAEARRWLEDNEAYWMAWSAIKEAEGRPVSNV